MAEKDFIKENIVGRSGGWKKRSRHYLRVFLSAVLFGGVSAVVFVFAVPELQAWNAKMQPTPAETVTLEQEEESPVSETSGSEETEEAIEDVIQSEMENFRFSVQAYEDMMTSLSDLATEADASVVEVRSIVNSTDFMGAQMETADTYAGLVIATTSREVLILAPEQAVSNADSIQIKLRSGTTVQGNLKGVDHADGLAVVSLSVSNLLQSELDQIKEIALGNSNQVRKGDTLIAVGAPAGVMHSTAYGMVSYVVTGYAGVDGSHRILLSDMSGNTRMGTYLLNTRGELIGWVSSKLGKNEEGSYVRIAGLSDFMERIERLSNGAQLPYLGIITQEVSYSMQNKGIPSGIYVQGCEQDAPAYQAGIQSGDIVTGINGETVASIQDYTAALNSCEVGDMLTVRILRQSGSEYKEMEFQMTAAAR